MRNIPTSWDLDTEYKDIESVNFWQKAKKMWANDPVKLQRAREAVRAKARDNSRTPVQWSSAPNGGFCLPNVKPWMRVNDDYKTINVEAQLAESESVFRFWQKCLKARKFHKDIFVYGDYHNVGTDNDDVFAYLRTGESGRALVVLNFSDKEVGWEVPASMEVAKWTVGSYGEVGVAGVGRIRLRAWEGLLGRCRE